MIGAVRGCRAAALCLRSRVAAAALPTVLALGCGEAWAVPLVVDGVAPADAQTAAAAVAGLPVDQLEPVSLPLLLQRPAGALGDATLRHCAGSPTSGAVVRAHVQRADLAVRSGATAEAADHLDLGLTALGCLGERVEPAVAARLFLMRGALAAADGQTEVARGELRTALSFVPQLAWDAALPGTAELLQAERAAHMDCPTAPSCAGGAPLRVLPSARSAGPWLDGRALAAGADPTPVPPGLHLLQVAGTGGLRSAWLTVRGESSVVLPDALRRPLTPGAGGPTDALRGLLALTLPGVSAAYVWADGGMWLVELDPAVPDRAALTTLQAPAAPPAEPPERRRR